MTNQEIGQLFDNNADCLTEVETDEPGYVGECDAMSKEMFVSLVSKLLKDKESPKPKESLFFSDLILVQINSILLLI